MRRSTKKVLTVLVALVVGWIVAKVALHERPSPPSIVLDQPDPEGARVPPSELANPSAAAADVQREVAAPTSGSMTTPAPIRDERSEGSTEIKGRFLLPNGLAAVGVKLDLNGTREENAGTIQLGARAAFTTRKSASDVDGRFSFRFDLVPDCQLTLDGALADYCTVGWSWYGIEPGTVTDVGTITLLRGGSVRARVVDANGQMMTHGWKIRAEGASAVSGPNKRAVLVGAEPDAESGEGLLANLPPGRTHLRAYSDLAGRIEGPDVQVTAGTEVRADIVYTGPDVSSHILVIPNTDPYFVFEMRDHGFVLSAPGFGERTPHEQTGPNPGLVFEDVPPGSYTLSCADPSFRPWSVSDVHPGSRVEARLVGNAAIVLSVVDDVTGAPISHFALDVHFDHANFGPNTFRILSDDEGLPRGGVFTGLVPHDQTFVVHASGYAACSVPAPALVANERRNVVARLRRGLRINGTIVRGSRRLPVDGAAVSARLETDGDPENSYSFAPVTGSIDVKSDDRGRFEIVGLDAGTYSIVATDGPLLNARRLVDLTQDAFDVELALPAAGRLVGRILAPTGTSFDGFRVVTSTAMRGSDGKLQDVSGYFPPHLSVPVDGDGRFRSPLVPAGEVQVVLRGPQFQLPLGFGGGGMEADSSISLGTVTLAPDVDTQHDFDLRATFPTPLVVRVFVDGRPATRALVSITEPVHGNQRGGGITDDRGIAQTGGLVAGQYLLFVGAGDGSWVGPSATSVTVPSTATIDVAIALFEGTLTVRDVATHAPLAQQEISLHPDQDLGWSSAHIRTDVDGRAHLFLPACRWRVQAGNRSGAFPADKSTLLDWGSTGPSPSEIEIKAWAY